jgi:hypothetical protein
LSIFTTDTPLAQELSIDNGIFQRFYDKSNNFTRIQWECKGKTENLLDYPIALLLHESLQEVYPDCYPTSPDVNSSEHPIQQAYSALLQSISSLFEGTKIHLWGRSLTIDCEEIRMAIPSNFFVSPYPKCPTLDSYTPEELFDFSCTACRKIFLTALDFWEGESISAKEYFKAHSTHYLNAGNWNLDTGLPCQYNNYKLMQSEDDEQHYSFKSDELRQIYYALKADYNPIDLPSK